MKKMSDYDDLKGIDFSHLWHPFTQSEVWFKEDPVIIQRAEGCELVDVQGRRYLDGVSSLWCNVHGHGQPEIVDAIQEQAGRLCHSTLLGLSHEPVLEFTERFASVLPSPLTRIFYSDSGSAAVEAALRMSLEWWQKQPPSAGGRRRKFLSLQEAYHGDTLGAAGVGYSQAFHRHLGGSIIPAHRFSPPHLHRFYGGLPAIQAEQKSFDELRAVLRDHGDEIAALILEPRLQGAAGMWDHSAAFLRGAVSICREHGLLIIADEVATGFGKSGDMFASVVSGVEPDMLVLGKGITGGYLPMSAVAATEAIFQAFSGPVQDRKTFFYGQTYAGNPLACAAAGASLKLLQTADFFPRLKARIELFHELIDSSIRPLPEVDEIRKFGVMIGIELTASPGKREAFRPEALAGQRIVREARARGVFIRPLGNVVTLMPALSMTEEQLAHLVRVTADSISALHDTPDR